MSIYDTHKPAGGGDYFKIEPGQTIKLRIASEPAMFDAEQKDGSISTKYAWIIWNQDEQQPQIMQMGPGFFRTVAGLAQDSDWGDPTGYDIKIKRNGTGLETRYETNPNPNREPLGTAAKKEIEAIDLIEKLKASQYAQHVMWLADADKPKSQPHSDLPADEPEHKPATKKDTVIEDLGDEPINLDDIPF